MKLSFGPEAYRRAGAERRDDADILLSRGRYVLSMYASGVAAECMLRALQGLRGEPFDDRHDLREMCRTIGRLGLIRSKGDDELLGNVGRLQATWRNNLRYATAGQSERFLRLVNSRLHSGRNSLARAAKHMFEAAASVVARGDVIWHRSKKS